MTEPTPKVAYATTNLLYDGRIYDRGEVLDPERVPAELIDRLLERGDASLSKPRA